MMKTYIRRIAMKNSRVYGFLSSLFIAALLFAVIAPTSALSNVTIELVDFRDSRNDCGLVQSDAAAPSGLRIYWHTHTNDDTILVADNGENDSFAVVLRDGNGTVLADYRTYLPLNTPLSPSIHGFGDFFVNDPNRDYPPPASRPWSMTIYDLGPWNDAFTSPTLDDYLAAPVIGSQVFDPAEYSAACASLPYVSGVSGGPNAVSINETGQLETQVFIAQDDDGNPALHIYEVNDAGQGEFSLAITQDMLAPFVGNPPASNTQIATSASGKVTLYVLDTGEFQINTGPDENGNVYVTIFDAIPPTNTYGYSFNVYDIVNGD